MKTANVECLFRDPFHRRLIFHRGETTVWALKDWLRERGVRVRQPVLSGAEGGDEG